MRAAAYPVSRIDGESRSIYGQIEAYGLPVDRERLLSIIDQLEAAYRHLHATVQEQTGLHVCPSRLSDVERAAIRLGVTLPRTPAGRTRIDQDSLVAYAALQPILQL